MGFSRFSLFLPRISPEETLIFFSGVPPANYSWYFTWDFSRDSGEIHSGFSAIFNPGVSASTLNYSSGCT